MIKNDSTTLRQKLETYFLEERGWTTNDVGVSDLLNATTDDQIQDALTEMASHLAEQKGWGEEGFVEILEQFNQDLGLN